MPRRTPITPPRPLSELWRHEFSAKTRARGTRYFEAGLANITAANPDGVLAVVQGTAMYAVRISWGDELDGGCNCPAFDKFGPCKHMWAVVLEIEAIGAEPEPEEPEPDLSPDDEDELPDIEDEPDDELIPFEPPEHRPPFAGGAGSAGRQREWHQRLNSLRQQMSGLSRDPWSRLSARDFEIRYQIDVRATQGNGELVLQTTDRVRLKDGSWGKDRQYSPGAERARPPEDPLDERLIAALCGAENYLHRYSWNYSASRGSEFVLGRELCKQLLPLLGETGRLDCRHDDGVTRGLRWDDGPPWVLELELVRSARETELSASLAREGERMDLAEPVLVMGIGFVLTHDAVARFDARGAMHWAAELRRGGPFRVPLENEPKLLAALTELPGDAVKSAPGLQWAAPTVPRPQLYIEGSASRGRSSRGLDCHITFDYGGVPVEPHDPRATLLRSDDSRLVRRDLDAEEQALVRFLEAGGRHASTDYHHDRHGTVAVGRMPALVDALLTDGWTVEADGKLWRRPGSFSVSVKSGLDWFDLEGGLEFEDQTAPFPELLAAAREGRNTVTLGDGSVGVLPERWLESWGLLALAGRAEGDGLRFTQQQGWLLDALLAEREGVHVDADFERFQRRLSRFRGIRPVREPRGFHGELRQYQRDGLAWFGFLRELGLGGCLADDMGLGKTVQVLALLEARRTMRDRDARRPSLVVAPRSLIFNWIDEARRFAPKLKVIDYTGPERRSRLEELDSTGLAVTTYGTLRRDVLELKDRHFDYVVLDEAQAIKNAASQSAKAARLLTANHRLALSGTPIENHIGELWSLFEFLNPGMLGRSSAFKAFASSRGSQQNDVDTLETIARALRPFFLRRTKDEVLDDLPEKTEQTIVCELDARERRHYDQLRDHYRTALLGREQEVGLARMKIQVLEALLRLRQSACHPGLIDPDHAAASSAKLDALIPRLEETAAEGHKALVFSQFTKLLAIVRARLDALGLTYEYLDGRTRKRKEKVDRFQSDPDCPLFLVSLKAGGHGLNLTAADYVFLLDPWWNPAVEAQAIDRAHRIGRTRPVCAYRLIAHNTVEEKVLELQERKRELARTLLSGGSGVLRDLTREDLTRLLS